MGSVTTFPQRTGVYDGTFPRVLAQSAIPFILAGGTAGGSSNQFTMGNNGAISTLPVLPTTYSGGAWIYMPANGIYSGSTAGWYWFVASSTTAGTVYNNQYTSGDPKLAVPATPTPFVSTGPGLVTQTLATDINGPQITLPANSLGKNGQVKTMLAAASSNSATAKYYRVRANGTNIMTTGLASVTGYGSSLVWANTNATNAQASMSGYLGSLSSVAPTFTAIDTAADVTLQISLRIDGAVSEYVVLTTWDMQVQYGA